MNFSNSCETTRQDVEINLTLCQDLVQNEKDEACKYPKTFLLANAKMLLEKCFVQTFKNHNSKCIYLQKFRRYIVIKLYSFEINKEIIKLIIMFLKLSKRFERPLL